MGQTGTGQNYQTAQLLSEKEAALVVFERQRAFAEHCLKQCSDEVFFRRPAPGMNSLAILVRHLADNLLSRWGDFEQMLAGTSDGEKPWRRREEEFADPEPTSEQRRALMQRWDEGWRTLRAALEPLRPEQFDTQITIRAAPHSVHLAMMRQLDHYAYHVGQIAFIARLLVGSAGWSYFTVAPGGSDAFTASVRALHEKPNPTHSTHPTDTMPPTRGR